MKKCSRCEELKTYDEFYKKGQGLQNYCKPCVVEYNAQWVRDNVEYARTRKRNWSRKNRKKVRNSELKSKYGISLEQYEELLKKQAGKCAICLGKQARALSVDHSHFTGSVRALLCNNCNHLLGKAKDDVNILSAAINYLLHFAGDAP